VRFLIPIIAFYLGAFFGVFVASMCAAAAKGNGETESEQFSHDWPANDLWGEP
jgi:hypothetical protein